MNAQTQRVDVLAVVDAAKKVVNTISVDGLVKPSSKNANAGFIDMRDWYALQGEVNELRAALAALAGDASHG